MMYRQRPRRMARRVSRFNPEMRLVAVLRNPIDRAYSGFVHHLKAGRLDPDTDMLEYVRRVRPRVDPLTIIAGGWYHASLKPYRRRFGNKLLVLLHDDVGEDPAAVYDRALAHVGATPASGRPTWRRPATATCRRRRAGCGPGDGYRPLDRAQRRELYPYFRDDIAKLEEMIGRDLDMWRPVPARSRYRPPDHASRAGLYRCGAIRTQTTWARTRCGRRSTACSIQGMTSSSISSSEVVASKPRTPLGLLGGRAPALARRARRPGRTP